MRKFWRGSQEARRRDDERYRAFIEHSSEGIWCVEVGEPISIDLPEDEQIRLMFERAAFTEVNSAMAAMYGLQDAAQLLGRSVAEVLLPSDPRNIDFLKAFIRSGYNLRDAESHEVDASGNPKCFLNNLIAVLEGRMIRRAWGTQRDITEQKKAEEALRGSEDRYRRLVELSPDAIFIHSGGRLVFANQATVRLLAARAPEDLVGVPVLDIVHPDCREAVEERVRRVVADRRPSQFARQKLLRLDGGVVDVEIAGSYFVHNGRPAVQVVGRDITQRLALEEQLRLSQKLEAVGRLAGGVAHDFNNLLTVIAGHGDLLARQLQDGDARRHGIEEIRKAAERAASLTRQLLAFSRKQVLQPKVLDLNEVLSEIQVVLRRVLGEDIDLATRLDPGIGRVRVDPGQIEQVVLNIAVNARDAMPTGGRLSLETTNVFLDAEFSRQHPPTPPGRYVLLSIADSGCGMDEETCAHLFEPFYTTKEVGKGTGLGLPTVYGIVKQSGGYIWAETAPNQGTTFRIYLPIVDGDAQALRTATVGEVRGGSETVLVVEDDTMVRTLVRDVLSRSGYTVLEAQGCGDALRICERHKGPIDLLLTDVVMPEANGRELAETLVSLRADMRVLYMSGHTEDAIVEHGILEQGIAFLAKPFSPQALARKVRETLDITQAA